MKCLKTGFRFKMDELVYTSDLFESSGNLTIVANREGWASLVVCDNRVIKEHLHLAPGVLMASMIFSEEYRAFHRKWNSETSTELLDEPVLLVFR